MRLHGLSWIGITRRRQEINTIRGQCLSERIGISMNERIGIKVSERIGINMIE